MDVRTTTKIAIGTALGFLLGVAVSYLVALDFRENGFLASHYATFFQPPRSETKVLAVVAALLVFAALPFGIAEWRADARFRREERRLREERPAAEVSPYEGPEGRGLVFREVAGQVLLLRPAGGMTGPVVVEIPWPPATSDESQANAP